jgi:hypothetical protein
MKLCKLSVLIMLMLLLASCGGGDGNNNVDVDLPQTFTYDGLTIKYPRGWVAREGNPPHSIEFANSQDVFGIYDANDWGKLREESALGVVQYAGEASFLSEMGLSEDATPYDVLTTLKADSLGESELYRDVEKIKVNGRDAAISTGSYELDGSMIDQVILLVDEGESFIFIGIQTFDDIEEYKDIVIAMAGAVEFVPN